LFCVRSFGLLKVPKPYRKERKILTVEDLSQSIGLLFMDLPMPQRDGYSATRAIRSPGHPNAQIPLIALSASAAWNPSSAAG
jgi:CheY-like chemotaxis protein